MTDDIVLLYQDVLAERARPARRIGAHSVDGRADVSVRAM
jgi:hypothetical protein